MLKKETLLSFPDFTKPFHVYTDASNRQLGATVVQEGKPLGFYTRKLNPAQKNYTVGKENYWESWKASKPLKESFEAKTSPSTQTISTYYTKSAPHSKWYAGD